jgi:hypothetical protein
MRQRVFDTHGRCWVACNRRLPADAIDNTGIAPDVLLPWNEPDPITP